MNKKVIFIALFVLALSILSACSEKTAGREQPAPVQAETNDPAAVDPVQAEVISAEPNLKKVTFYSDSLRKEMKFNLYLPAGYEENKKYPVLYILHGYGENEDSWMPDLGLDQAADKLIQEDKIDPLIIISPDISTSYGFNSASMGKYSDYIVQDLIQYVDSRFNTAASRESRYIGGLSMGGWAALFNAFTHPDLYSKVGGHSAAIWMNDWSNTGDLKSWIYPTEEMQKQRDPLLLADSQNLSGLSVYLDAGDKDSYKLYEGAEALNRILQNKGVPSEYHLAPGGHDGDYWKQHTSEYLLFYAGKQPD